MALQKNKVKFGLNKVHWAKITAGTRKAGEQDDFD